MPTSVFDRSIFETKLKAMVFCRGVACFLGYPITYDSTFTNHYLLGIFLDILLAYADGEALWDFTAADISTVFVPLLNYADLDAEEKRGKISPADSLSDLSQGGIDWMEKKFTFGEAFELVVELDGLASSSISGDIWMKWFEFVRYAEWIHIKEAELRDSTWYPWVRTRVIGMMMMCSMEPAVSEQQFFLTCCKLHEYLPANYDYKERVTEIFSENNRALHCGFPTFMRAATLAKLRHITGDQPRDIYTIDKNNQTWFTTPDISISTTSSEPSRSKVWALPAEFTPEMYTPLPISSRMTELLRGSLPEPWDPSGDATSSTFEGPLSQGLFSPLTDTGNFLAWASDGV